VAASTRCCIVAMLVVALIPCILGCTSVQTVGEQSADRDPLPSWRSGVSKDALVGFVARASAAGSSDFVPESERIAVFDQDGTLWAERPFYIQLAFAVDRVHALAVTHPEWASEEPFASILKGDLRAATAQGEAGIARLIAATHGGMTVDEFRATVRGWLATARHPETGRLYREMVYQPMLELLSYLRANGFKTYIVSGGGTEFVRAFALDRYGIPTEQVIGSDPKLELDTSGGRPEVRTTGEIEFIDDGPGKPLGIMRRIGRRPTIAVGNSDGDFEMLDWVASGDGSRLAVLIHHTDAKREWSYDRASHVGRLDRALDRAAAQGWLRIDMARDWDEIYPALR
jgi:phosphoserine phosphatase